MGAIFLPSIYCISSVACAGPNQLLTTVALDEALSTVKMALQRSHMTLHASLVLDDSSTCANLHKHLVLLCYVYVKILLCSMKDISDALASGSSQRIRRRQGGTCDVVRPRSEVQGVLFAVAGCLIGLVFAR